MIKKTAMAVAAVLSMAAMPTMAVAQSAWAARLSVAGARTAATTNDKSELAGGGILIAAIAAAAVIAAIVIAADNKDDKPASA